MLIFKGDRPHVIALALIVDPFAASALRQSVGSGVPAGPNLKNVPARRPAPTRSKERLSESDIIF